MSVTLYSTACSNSIAKNYEQAMNFSSMEPYPWDSMIVSSSDADGNPLIVNFYLGTTLQFIRTWTYDASGNVTSLTIS